MEERFLSTEEIMGRDRVYGGKVRHTLVHDSGEIENVSLNNLLAIQSGFAIDVCSNKFLSQFLLPSDFYQRVNDKCMSKGLFIEFLDKDEFGGISGVVALATIQRYSTDDGTGPVILYVPFADTVFEFDVTDEHWLKGKEEMGGVVGKNKGFDLIIPFHPMLGYAPPRLLLGWVEEGYKAPQGVLDKIALMSGEEKRELVSRWERNGWDDSKSLMLSSGLAKPEEFLLLEEGKSES